MGAVVNGKTLLKYRDDVELQETHNKRRNSVSTRSTNLYFSSKRKKRNTLLVGIICSFAFFRNYHSRRWNVKIKLNFKFHVLIIGWRFRRYLIRLIRNSSEKICHWYGWEKIYQKKHKFVDPYSYNESNSSFIEDAREWMP